MSTCKPPGILRVSPILGEQGDGARGPADAPILPSSPAHPAALSITPKDSKASKVAFLQYQLREGFDGEMEIPENCSLFVQRQTKEFRGQESPVVLGRGDGWVSDLS